MNQWNQKFLYIICALGGGIGDIVTHQRINENNIEKINEKYPSKGGPYGTNVITRDILRKKRYFIVKQLC